MSGSSLDGVDIACCDFVVQEDSWSYIYHFAETIPFTDTIRAKLLGAPSMPAKELEALDAEFGTYLGKLSNSFIKKHQIEGLELIASHGHTVFHHPEEGFSTQIGSGAHLAAASGYSVVCDLRSGDLAKGGQGAPIVPIGEKMLFQAYDAFLNIGGIANLSVYRDDLLYAWDVGAANQVLNHLAEKAGKAFDRDGEMAKAGKVNYDLLDKLEGIDFYNLEPPRSMDNQYVASHYFPLFEGVDIYDGLATFSEHLVSRIIKEMIRFGQPSRNLLVTGGGAYNSFLIEKLRRKLPEVYVHVPAGALVEYKEALIMGFIGLLRYLGKPNVLSTVTGAREDACSGALYMP